MAKLTFKHIFPFIILIAFCVPIATYSVLDMKQKEEQRALEEKILQEKLAKELAQKKAEEKIYLMGQFDPAAREDFVPIPSAYTLGGNKMYLRKETYDAFIKMKNAAEEDGVILKIASATRNFDYQRNLWNNKWTGDTLVAGKDLSKSIPDGLERFQKILEYSAAPSTSRHHWGTDIDLNDANPEYFDTAKGRIVYAWLVANAPSFGFCQTYNEKGGSRQAGYNEEKWHWSYLPLAKQFTKDYKDLITDDDIKGFDGEEYAKEINLISNYVLSINPDCL